MNLLQPYMLYAAPFIALPIIIHLINQRRYQTMRWGAMRFLLTANKMSTGYAKIRQWLILACRTLAIAGLVFAACRPLASGFLGLFGGAGADTTIVLLDRSPSMSQKGAAGTLTKREASQQQLVETLKKLNSTHWVLIESDRVTPRELESIDTLLDLQDRGVSSTSADVPAMLDAAAKYIENNKTGRTDIWVCSDLRSNDWRNRSAEWKQLRDKFLAFPQGIRFHLFGYAKPAPENLAVEVTEVERVSSESGSELVVSLRLSREESVKETISVPVQFEIEGGRSQTVVELTGKEFELRGHRIPIDSTLTRGFGRVSIPADSNDADDEFFFAFDIPHPRNSVLVMEDVEQAAALKFAAEVPPSGSVECKAEVIEPHQVDAIAWESVSLVLWHAPLPKESAAKLLEDYVARGGQIIFYPPESPAGESFFGVTWTDWEVVNDPVAVTSWTVDQDLLANSISGMSLPVGDLQTLRYCPPKGELTTLAALDGGDVLMSRLPTTNGGVYFCSTTTYQADSTLASNGAVLYVAVQRALANGASVLGKARQGTAGKMPEADELAGWQQRAGSEDVISTDYGFNAGVYERNDQLLAVNRASDENHAAILSDEQLNGLFDGLDFSLVQNEVGSKASLVQEIWRTLLITMIVMLLAEALLCVPRKLKPADEKNSIFRERAKRDAVLKEMQGAA